MPATLKVIEETTKQKKKLKQSKNKKKTWRKHINLSDIEVALEEQEQDERLGCLGEDTSNLLFLDTGDGNKDIEASSIEETERTGIAPPINLEYVIDTNTGLKASSKPKSNKLIHSHRFLAGLPGATGPYKGNARVRKEDTFDHKLSLKLKSNNNSRNAFKDQVKQARAWRSQKISKKNIKQVQKLSFDKNLWDEGPEPTTSMGSFREAAMDHVKQVMCTKPINSRGSKVHPSKIPAVLLPHPGLSYNPDLESHQQLLRKAVKRETRRAASTRLMQHARTIGFPLGADVVSQAEVLKDMNSELPSKPEHIHVKEEPEDGEAPTLPVARARKTHKQRLRELRHNKQLRDVQRVKQLRKREIQINRLPQLERELDTKEAALQRRAEKRAEHRERRQHLPPRHFVEGDVEVALGDELRGRLLHVLPTGNAVSDRLQHLRRRGLLHCRPKDRKYEHRVHRSLLKRYKKRTIDSFTEGEMAPEKKVKSLGKD